MPPTTGHGVITIVPTGCVVTRTTDHSDGPRHMPLNDHQRLHPQAEYCYHMATILNAIYLIAVILIGIVGTLFVASVHTTESSPRWLELSSVGVVLLFLLALGIQFLA